MPTHKQAEPPEGTGADTAPGTAPDGASAESGPSAESGASPEGAAPKGAAAGRGRRGGLLRQRDFRLLWTGETANRFGSNITSVAMPLVAVVTLEASTFWVSVLAAAAWLPWLLIGLPAGAWVDRLPRRPLMIACNVGSLLLLTSVPAAAWLDILTMTHLIVVALLMGVANVFFSIAYRVYLPSIVAREDLQEANSKLQGSESVAQLAGLSGGGMLAGVFGAVSGLLANAGTFLISTLCLLGIRSTEPPPEQPQATRDLRKEVKDGLRYTVRDPYLRVLTAYGTVTNLLLTGFQVLLTIFMVRELGTGEAQLGLLLAGMSVGGLLGAVVATPLARRFGTAHGMLLCKFASAPFGLLVPLAQPGWRSLLIAVGGAVLALGIVSANVIQSTFRQQYCPPAMLGRITASMSVANFGAIPIGSLLGGALGSVLGIRPALWVLTAGLAVSSALLLMGPLRSHRNLPTDPAPTPEKELATHPA